MSYEKYVAFYSKEHEYEQFQTIEEAEAWLKKEQEVDASDEGVADDTINGFDFIAKIIKRSKFVKIENRDEDGYIYNEDDDCYYLDGDPENDMWSYPNHVKFAGEIVMEDIR